MSLPQDILRRRALEYHQREDRASSCGNMSLDMDLIFSGFVAIGPDTRLHITDAGRAFLASGIETEGQDAQRLGAEHESPAPKGDAQ